MAKTKQPIQKQTKSSGGQKNRPSKSNSSQTNKLVAEGKTASKRKVSAKKKDVDTDQSIRLNKFLADAGIASRRKADELIKAGAVKINNNVVVDLSTKVLKSDFVTVNGDPITIYKHLTYILLNKPKDYITTTSDEKGRKTIFDIVKKHMRLFPIGRLDRNTTGAILITNDGELANRLTHPSYQIPRIYNVSIDKALTMEHMKMIADGVELEDGMTGKCNVYMFPDDKQKIKLEIFEGKNREVRRIFEFLGYEVKKLDQKIFAGISTQGLKRGEYRHLEKREIKMLKDLVGLY